ncbi:MAG: hemolysin III [Armatimonadota bacterium]|nr:MAG: hemolysin III [Armatimonadota bacterium]
MRWIREPFSGLSHFAGLGMSVAALAVLAVLAAGSAWSVTGVAIYGSSLILLYLASTLYHSLRVPPHWERRLQQFDHIGIYLLIAGTYAPVCLTVLRGGWGWSLLGIEYALAATGIGITLLWKDAPAWVRMVLYILMGWLAVIAIVPLAASLPPAAFGWLVAGGVVYSVGAVVFALDRPHLWPGRFSAHDLWHVFVLGGSICHFVVVLQSVSGA